MKYTIHHDPERFAEEIGKKALAAQRQAEQERAARATN